MAISIFLLALLLFVFCHRMRQNRLGQTTRLKVHCHLVASMLAWYCSAIVNKLIHSELMIKSSAIYDKNGTISEEIFPQNGQFLLGKEDQSQRFDLEFVRKVVFKLKHKSAISFLKKLKKET